MRKLGGVLLATAGLILFLADARSQTMPTILGPTQTPSSFSMGANPRQINFTRVDTSKALQPTASLSKAFTKPGQQTPPGLGSMFPKISLGSWPPKLPNVSILPSNPFSQVTPKK